MLLFIPILLLVWLGGWLLTAHVLRLRTHERLTSGLALGLVLYIVFSNLISHVLNNTWAFITAALVVLGMGLLSPRGHGKPWFTREDLRGWPQLIAIFGLGMVFTLILSGISIWDDYHNLPIVSTLAAGNMPPQFYLNSSISFYYHYGLHILSASLVATGGFTPWSSWDIARGFTTAIAIVMGWLWFKRSTGSDLVAYFGAFLLTFGSGTLWLISLLPGDLLLWISANTPLANSALDSGPSLADNLSRPFVLEGGPPLPLPFALKGSLLVPTVLNWGGTSSLYLLGLFLFLLASRKEGFSIYKTVILSLVLALMALNAEHVVLLLMAGCLIGVFIPVNISWQKKKRISSSLKQFGFLLLISLPVIALQGGMITGVLRAMVAGDPELPSGLSIAGFFIQWPPAMVASYYEPLHLTNPAQMIVALAELGPVILLGPAAAIWTWKLAKKGRWIEAGLGVSGVLGFLLPWIVHYGVERDTSRFTNYALQVFLIMGIPWMGTILKQGKSWLQGIVLVGSSLSVISGVVVFGILSTAITMPKLSFFIDPLDARMSGAQWDQLRPDSLILDRIPYRAVTLFGRLTHSSPPSGAVDFGTYPEWDALIENPDPVSAARSGYAYIYMEHLWWEELDASQQATYGQPCVILVEEIDDPGSGAWRRLLDISGCK